MILRIFTIVLMSKLSIQICQEEISTKGISVIWRSTASADNVKSDPVCYSAEQLVTRNCHNSTWSPSFEELPACTKTVSYFDSNSCPPGFNKINNISSQYCYEITKPTVWNYPCFENGAASIITDLDTDEVNSLLDSLKASQISEYFWLPAQRHKLFNPVLWSVPGPNWGRLVETSSTLPVQTSIFTNCLVLDVINRILITKSCNDIFPSLCFQVNDLYYPAKCPDGYQAFRFMSDDGSCFGIENADLETSMTLRDFLTSKCASPMGNSHLVDITKFIYTKMASNFKVPDDQWCWFLIDKNNNDTDPEQFQGAVINNAGTLTLVNSTETFPCIACEKSIFYRETELSFEYSYMEKKMYLTIYYPTGLWKYNSDDTGVRCFSNAKGFITSVAINDLPFLEINYDLDVDKVVYVIDLISDSMGQYWCEGHLKNFSLISTNKLVVSPKGNKEQVFALFLKFKNYNYSGDSGDFNEVLNKVSEIFNVKNVILMDILEITHEYVLTLIHLHVTANSNSTEIKNDLINTFYLLEERAKVELPKFDFTYVNISSLSYCLPTTSVDIVTLDWDVTPIGQITASRQFCLQSNGLPVKRRCLGSYTTGGVWGPVEGSCDFNYVPSNITTFLYKFVKDRIDATHFLTDGLNYVLNDTTIMIPADIYYLSKSLEYISTIATENKSCVEMGDLENIAWAMDRLMTLDYDYLNLAQTMNSTNVILTSMNEIIDIFTMTNSSNEELFVNETYQLAVQPKFVVQISFPEMDHVTGLALIRNSSSDYFTDMLIVPLFKNSSLDYLMSIHNLEVATWIPEKALNSMKAIQINDSFHDSSLTEQSSIHIAIHVFYNDAVFQEIDQNKHEVNSRIVEISIPGFVSNLEYAIPLIFRDQLKENNSNKQCSYWDFQSYNTDGISGSWKSEGCYFVKTINDLTLCKCYHLTHFAQLITTGMNKRSVDDGHERALNVITLFGSFLSLVGILGLWVTAIVFTTWRKKQGTKVLLQLSTAIAVPLIIIIIFNLDTKIFVEVNEYLIVPDNMIGFCIILGATLHYSILAGFVWMLIVAILQFLRYVRVLGVSRPSRFMLKLSLMGWGIPTLPVTAVLMLDKNNYIPALATKDVHSGLCYPSGIYLYLSVLLPILIILMVNVVLFLLVMFSISRGPDGKMRASDLDLVKSQLRLSIFLFFLLGLTWIFGIFSFSRSLLWSYLFCLTGTVQGFVLFIYFVICDPATRNLWITLMKQQNITKSQRDSISSISSISI